MYILLMLFISFISLLWAANHLVVGSSVVMHHFTLNPLIIGLSILALGVSIPEIFFSIRESLQNENSIIVGNTIGSNIANISLVLGITIIIKPHALNYYNLKKTCPILLIAMLFVYSLIIDGYLSRIDGCLILLTCLIALSVFVYLTYHTNFQDQTYQFKSAIATSRSLTLNIIGVLMSIVVLTLSSKFFNENTLELAKWFKINKLTTGVIMQALCTTLPVLATAVIAAIKGEEDLAIGTILGSNIYNLVLVITFPALINPIKINPLIVWRDMPLMVFLTVFLIFLNYNYKKQLSLWHGGVLILVYVCYISSLFIKTYT